MMDVWVSLGRRKHHDSQQNRVNKKKIYHERGEYSESIITARSAGALVFSNQLTIKGNTSEQRINRRLQGELSPLHCIDHTPPSCRPVCIINDSHYETFFIRRKILSGETALSAQTHSHTHRHLHTRVYCVYKRWQRGAENMAGLLFWKKIHLEVIHSSSFFLYIYI